MHETDAIGLRRVESLGGEKVAMCHALAHRANQIRADRCRDQTELRFRHAELDAGRGYRNVACGNEAQAARVDRAVNAGDRRLPRARK